MKAASGGGAGAASWPPACEASCAARGTPSEGEIKSGPAHFFHPGAWPCGRSLICSLVAGNTFPGPGFQIREHFLHEYFRSLIQSAGKKGEGILMGILIHVSSLSAWKPIKPITTCHGGNFHPTQATNIIRPVQEILVQRVFLTGGRSALLLTVCIDLGE